MARARLRALECSVNYGNPKRLNKPIVPHWDTHEPGANRGGFLRLYVGNLQREFNEVDVRELFSPYGQVDSVTIIRDSDTRRPKGFAFVEMPIVIQAKAAINALNGNIFHQPTRTLIVNEADSQLDRIVRKAVRRTRPLSRLIPIRHARAHHR